MAVFGLIILFMVIWAGILLALILGFGIQDGDEEGFIILLPAILLIFITYMPYFNWIMGKVYRFKGEGEPLPPAELRKKILELNEYDVPVMVKEKRKKLIITWKYVDAKWYELIAKAGLKKLYELHIKFKQDENLVTLIDVNKTVYWRAAPTQVKIRGGFFRGVMLHWEISKLWGLDENFKFRKIYDYKFTPSEIKNPVLNSILRSGWDVRFRMW